MSDYGDFCREQRAEKQTRRAKSFADNYHFKAKMQALGFTSSDLPGGQRFSYKFPDGRMLRVDWWPSSTKWTVVGSNVYRKGGNAMEHYAKAHTTAEGLTETSKPIAPKASITDRPTGPGNPPWDDCPCDICKKKGKTTTPT